MEMHLYDYFRYSPFEKLNESRYLQEILQKYVFPEQLRKLSLHSFQQTEEKVKYSR